MVHILGSNNLVAQLGPLRLWAENGIVCMEDSRDNGYTQCNVRTTLERVQAINDMIGNTLHKGIARDTPEIKMMQKFVDDTVAICRKAQEQGEPTDKSSTNSRKASLPTSVSVPSAPFSNFDM